MLYTTYLPVPHKLPVNLNPPFLLWFLLPISYFPYQVAVRVWFFLSMISGLIAATMVAEAKFFNDFYKKNDLILLLIYLSLYPTLVNQLIDQIGTILLLLLILGYHFL